MHPGHLAADPHTSHFLFTISPERRPPINIPTMASRKIKRPTKGDATEEKIPDVDDADIDRYLVHTVDEIRFKKMIWEVMNKDYIEEQKAKKAGNQPKRKKNKKIAERSAKRSRRGEEAAVEQMGKSSKVDYHALALSVSEKDERKKERMDGGHGGEEAGSGKNEKAGCVGVEAEAVDGGDGDDEEVDACHEDGDEDRINYDDYYTDEGEDYGHHDYEDD